MRPIIHKGKEVKNMWSELDDNDKEIYKGFPKDYKLPEDMAPSRLYKQAGNSVCVSVIKRIAENLAKSLV